MSLDIPAILVDDLHTDSSPMTGNVSGISAMSGWAKTPYESPNYANDKQEYLSQPPSPSPRSRSLSRLKDALALDDSQLLNVNSRTPTRYVEGVLVSVVLFLQ